MGSDSGSNDMIYRLTISVRVEERNETAALRDCALRLLRMTQNIPDGERRRLFMEGDSVSVQALANPLVLPYGVK